MAFGCWLAQMMLLLCEFRGVTHQKPALLGLPPERVLGFGGGDSVILSPEEEKKGGGKPSVLSVDTIRKCTTLGSESTLVRNEMLALEGVHSNVNDV